MYVVRGYVTHLDHSRLASIGPDIERISIKPAWPISWITSFEEMQISLEVFAKPQRQIFPLELRLAKEVSIG